MISPLHGVIDNDMLIVYAVYCSSNKKNVSVGICILLNERLSLYEQALGN